MVNLVPFIPVRQKILIGCLQVSPSCIWFQFHFHQCGIQQMIIAMLSAFQQLKIWTRF